MKVWITKYALTKGMSEVDLDKVVGAHINGENLYYRVNGFPIGYIKGEWHTEKSNAIAKAEEMRTKKIASLKKQIEKLENLNFE